MSEASQKNPSDILSVAEKILVVVVATTITFGMFTSFPVLSCVFGFILLLGIPFVRNALLAAMILIGICR